MWQSAAPSGEHQWRGHVRRLDMNLYLAHLLEDRSLPPLLAAVVQAIGAELVGSDPALAQVLADANIASLLTPVSLLMEIARQRGWSATTARKPTWEAGMIDHIDGHCL